jgi:hypothetical protein
MYTTKTVQGWIYPGNPGLFQTRTPDDPLLTSATAMEHSPSPRQYKNQILSSCRDDIKQS